jgi:hypothetical protein
MPNKPPKHVVDYFRRGQLLFLVDGTWNDASAQDLIDWANPITIKKRVTINNVRSVRFPTVEELIGGQTGETEEAPPPVETGGPVLSLDTSEGKKAYASPVVVENGGFTLVAADVPELAEIPAPEDPGQADKLSQNASSLLNLVKSLDKIRSTFPVGKLQVVSPNWLASSSKDSVPGGTGGPGAKPTAADGPAQTEEYRFNFDDLPQEIHDYFETGKRGDGVVVAILDTAPKKSVDEIRKIWVTDRPDDPHPIIGRLLDPDNPLLTIHFDPNVDLPTPNIEPEKYIQADGHDYEMTDHGLFVAGVINSLASEAQLHLYQVLNRYGVGDLLSIAQHLSDAYTSFAGGPLVFSLSLTFGPPIVKDHSKDDQDDDMGRSLLSSEDDEPEDPWFGRRDLVARRICDLAYATGSRVIAAAGNNHKKNTVRPQACYPAALDSVLGVGALPKGKKPQDSNKKLKAASYSNLSDRPEGTGITTLGGEKGKGKGVLGIYIEGFPRDENPADGNPETDPSKNGWGWWAGTSFATPVISGITAVVLSNMPGSTTEQAIKKLFDAQSYLTDANEDVLFVTQGSTPP